jgi:hypothetical protein
MGRAAGPEGIDASIRVGERFVRIGYLKNYAAFA